MKKFGKPGTVMLRYAYGRLPQTSCRSAPSRPVTVIGNSTSVARKPVAYTMISAGYSVPSAVTTPVGVIRSMGLRTSSTLSRLSVFSQLPLSCRVRFPVAG